MFYKGQARWGALEGENARLLKSTPKGKIIFGGDVVPLTRARLLSPVKPSKIILAGLNYRDHAKELRMPIPAEPVIFLKAPTAVIGHNDVIVYPSSSERIDYEGELAVIMKKKCVNVKEERVKDFILGYTCLNDVTARDLQKKDGQWTRAKSFDTFCPIGPWIETDLDLSNTRVRVYLNGRLKQNAGVSEFIFSPEYLVSFASRIMTLMPFDVISTGTPKGVGPMKRGDKIEVDIEGIGKLTNYVK